jgi:hypothetical protein
LLIAEKQTIKERNGRSAEGIDKEKGVKFEIFEVN